jgi:hypothetical protein
MKKRGQDAEIFFLTFYKQGIYFNLVKYLKFLFFILCFFRRCKND